MSTRKKNATGDTSPLRSAVLLPAYLVGLSALFVVASYWFWLRLKHGLKLSPDPADWGTFGDYVGGILNPLCAFMAFVWLVRSYALQKTELTETRNTLRESLEAQKEQARLALLSAQTQSLSIRLSVLNSTKERLCSAHARAVDHANTHGGSSDYISENGSAVKVKPAITAMFNAINQIERDESKILHSLNELAIQSNEEMELAASLE